MNFMIGQVWKIRDIELKWRLRQRESLLNIFLIGLCIICVQCSPSVSEVLFFTSIVCKHKQQIPRIIHRRVFDLFTNNSRTFQYKQNTLLLLLQIIQESENRMTWHLQSNAAFKISRWMTVTLTGALINSHCHSD